MLKLQEFTALFLSNLAYKTEVYSAHAEQFSVIKNSTTFITSTKEVLTNSAV
tara:strand:- start:667 stop:822 length:156 start_codon:yes stop_codon:yes gene_type:complete